jgi:hypothetical protein
MSAESATTSRIELHYSLTKDDLLDALAAQRRSVRRPWYLRRLRPLLTATIVVIAVLRAVSGKNVSGSSVAALAVVLIVALLATVGFSLLLGRVLDRSRMAYRLPVRLIMRGNPALSEAMQATVTDTGMHLVTAGAETTWRWAHYPLHVETDRSFVLLTSPRSGAAVLVLPKTGTRRGGPNTIADVARRPFAPARLAQRLCDARIGRAPA